MKLNLRETTRALLIAIGIIIIILALLKVFAFGDGQKPHAELNGIPIEKFI